MSDILGLLFLNALWVLGIKYATRDGELLGFIPKIFIWVRLKLRVPDGVAYFVTKPVWGCIVCMSSVHGVGFQYLYLEKTVPFYLSIHWVWDYVSVYGGHCVCLAGMLLIISLLQNLLINAAHSYTLN